MHIAVIGAGGTGGLYGGVLARAGHEVAFLARGEHLRYIRERGLQVRSADFGTFVVHAQASNDPNDLHHAELVIFAVKTYDMAAAAGALDQLLAEGGHVLTLQNGVEAPDWLAARIGKDRVLIGTTSLETTILEPGVIGHLSPGHVVTVGAFEGPPTPATEQVARVLEQAGINTHLSPDGHQALWDKACLLIPIATVTSVCRATVGGVRAVPAAFELLEGVMNEVVEVARVCGYDLAPASERALKMWSTLPAGWKTSMMRDFERGNRTEHDALTGAIVRLAEAHGVNVSRTRALYAVLQVMAESPAAVGIAAGGR